MFKVLSLSFLIVLVCSNSSLALNVLQENATLRGQLNSLSSQQQAENRKNLLYYKGRSSYVGIDKGYYRSYSSSSYQKENLYEKKRCEV